MRILENFNSFKFNEGDLILIHYWYDDSIVPVKIIEKVGRRYKISYDVNESPIWNAPEELIHLDEIIDKFRK